LSTSTNRPLEGRGEVTEKKAFSVGLGHCKRAACFAKIARFVNSKGASLAQHFYPVAGSRGRRIFTTKRPDRNVAV